MDARQLEQMACEHRSVRHWMQFVSGEDHPRSGIACADCGLAWEEAERMRSERARSTPPPEEKMTPGEHLRHAVEMMEPPPGEEFEHPSE